MESVEQCLLKYRHALRIILGKSGVATNLAIADSQLLDEISILAGHGRIVWFRCNKCGGEFPGETSLSMHQTSHESP
jgi:hypothetical protein